MRSEVAAQAEEHLLRSDGQEDLCFGIWHPSIGRRRFTALLTRLILPIDGDRLVHGNASFLPQFFERAVSEARAAGGGLAFLHSHPGGRGWQGLSQDDTKAELDNAATVRAATALPMLGFTLAGDRTWSARFWEKIGPRKYLQRPCTHVRVVGERFALSFNYELQPQPQFKEHLSRTVSAWGASVQANLAGVRVGIIGAGSVGSIIAESLARIGIVHLTLIDFDTLKTVNLDRTLHAHLEDARRSRSKVQCLAAGVRRTATAADFTCESIEFSIGEDEGFRAALDCDVLFSCVDRPWGRSVLNFIAYAHLIPVVDGGILVTVKRGKMQGADWRAHVAAPGRRCLECRGQYDPGLVEVERRGFLDDPHYIEGLPPDHIIRRNENVFAFSFSVAGLQVLQLLSMIVSPQGVSDPGAQMYHFTTGRMDVDEGNACNPNCLYPPLIAIGDHTGLTVTAPHKAAEAARAERAGTGSIAHKLTRWLLRFRKWLR